jgi:plastocyanin
MSPRGVPITQAEQAQNELLAQLGLPPSASPDDVDRLHEAASEFLAAAPPHLRGWAHAQVAALDAAYLELTDPVGLEGSALRSPTRPSAVVPGGPATPPARRDPLDEEIPAAVAAAAVAATMDQADTADAADLELAAAGAASPEDVAASIDGEPDAEELAALYASVTPSAHEDMIPSARRPTKKERREARKVAAVTKASAAPAPAATNPWKRLYIATVGIAAVLLVGVVGFNLLFGSASAAPISSGTGTGAGTAQASPALDPAAITALMEKLQANPEDVETLLALANEYYAAGARTKDTAESTGYYETAGTWLDKVIALEPDNERAVLSRGAVYFNIGDLDTAEKVWTAFATKFPDNQEVHYDLGFLYLNRENPDWNKVKQEWEKVVEIDSTTSLAQTVSAHLDSLVTSSMMPGASGGPSASGAPGASGGPSAAPSAAPSAGASAAPAASPAANVLQQSAANVQFGFPTLAAKAGTPFIIQFANNDTVQHDIVIDDAAGKRVFTGALIDGGTTTDYQVNALPAGTYTVRCSIHPAMTSTLTVGS